MVFRAKSFGQPEVDEAMVARDSRISALYRDHARGSD
jgi:hypothetical protein